MTLHLFRPRRYRVKNWHLVALSIGGLFVWSVAMDPVPALIAWGELALLTVTVMGICACITREKR